MNTETDPAVTLENLTAGYRERLQRHTEELEVIVPLWWVGKWGHEAVAAAAARLHVKVTAVDAWQDDNESRLTALVFEAGTWHVERGPAIDLSGVQQHGI
jgi:hypothetical protein